MFKYLFFIIIVILPTFVRAGDYTSGNVDFVKIKNTWIDRHNNERKSLWLNPYTWSLNLDKTAQKWADYLLSQNKTTHKRLAKDWYYNYVSMQNWFNNLWVYFVGSSTNFSESIGWWYQKCKKADCTDSLTKSIKSTFNFFMSEKWKWYRPHYNGIIMKKFNLIWLGVAVGSWKYYLVTHYGTKLVSSP